MSTIDSAVIPAQAPLKTWPPEPKSGYPIHWGRLNRQRTPFRHHQGHHRLLLDVHLSHHSHGVSGCKLTGLVSNEFCHFLRGVEFEGVKI